MSTMLLTSAEHCTAIKGIKKKEETMLSNKTLSLNKGIFLQI